MIISDINYLETVAEDVHGAGARLLASLTVSVTAPSYAAAVINQEGYASAQTSKKIAGDLHGAGAAAAALLGSL